MKLCGDRKLEVEFGGALDWPIMHMSVLSGGHLGEGCPSIV